ncbi:MAG: 7-cyano-7-deazaguanine synthase [Candidatus Omnitrophica bacterium]|nr:7-cyano-7-deazaguanine synthase [Candidatus Omnitrophota bacterium]MDD5436758.1 7-cyano-7-deazaguanine synthase [Candidatus Omnitrophota bacterium]
MNKKCIAMLSGGLDSILAIKVMQEQGVEVRAVNFSIDFCACIMQNGENVATKAAKALGVPVKVVDITEEYLTVLKNPRHGYGANINPCIDCKIFMLKKAKEIMAESGASFIITGEVLGERPMSQRLDALNIIARDSGLKGFLLRPLSAKLLDPTIPEKEGVVDREKLLDISGRSRKPQFALADKYGIKEYPNPAGGCLLTDPGFTSRVKDLIKHDALTTENLKFLTVGRHFRLSPSAKLAVGRDQGENEVLEAMATEKDTFFKLKDRQGPLAVLRGACDDKIIPLAASVAAYHTKFRTEPNLSVNYWSGGSQEKKTVSVRPASLNEIESLRL